MDNGVLRLRHMVIKTQFVDDSLHGMAAIAANNVSI